MLSVVLSLKNILGAMAATALMSDQSPIGFLEALASTVGPSSIGYLLISDDQSLIYYIKPKAYDIVLMVDLFFIDELFRLKNVICKKYTSTSGKDSKYANAIEISII